MHGMLMLALCLVPVAVPQDPGPRPERAQHRRQLQAKRDLVPTTELSDAEFFAALAPDVPGLAPTHALAAAREFERAWAALDAWIRDSWVPADGLRALEHRPPSEERALRAERMLAGALEVAAMHFEVTHPMDWTQGAGRNAYAHLHSWRWSRDLVDHHLLETDGRAAALVAHLVDSWYAQRVRITAVSDFDAVWYELAVGGRAVAWTQLLWILRERAELPLPTRKRMLTMILASARHAARQQACGYTEGNWQVAGAGALLELGTLLPMFRESDAWRATGRRRLLEHVAWDHDADGGHLERTWGYGMGVVAKYHRMLSTLRDDPHADDARVWLERMLGSRELWFLKLVAPDGHMPGVHDSSSDDLASWLVALASRSGDGRYTWPIRARASTPTEPPPRRPDFTNVHLPGSGFTVLRSDWEPTSSYMLVDWGAWGRTHIHAAVLDVNVYARGAPLLIEGGSLGYDHPLDAWLRTPAAHNMLVIEGAELQRSSKGARVPRFRAQGGIAYFEGYHDGWKDSAGVRVRRRVLAVDEDYWLVVDTVHGPVGSDVPNAALHWHAPAPFRAHDGALVSGDGPGVQLFSNPGADVALAVEYEDENELYRSRYAAVSRRPARGGTRFVTLIAPFLDEPNTGAVALTTTDYGFEVRVELGELRDRVLVRTIDGSTAVGAELVTDGAVAWIREGGTRAAVIDGATVTWNGEQRIARDAPLPIALAD